MRPLCFHFQVTAFVLGSDISHMVRDLQQFIPAVIGLDDDAFLRLGDVVLKADNVLKT